MKMKISFCFCIGLIVILSCCAVQKKVEYEFPVEMLPHVKEAYKLQCDKGQILYNINCASCHTQKKGRKLILPTFKESQLKGYELRVANAKHESSLPDEKVSEEELALIMSFLRYKKPSIK